MDMAKSVPKDLDVSGGHAWDPLKDFDEGVLTATASTRIKRDLMNIFKDPPPGLFVVGDETNIKIVHAIIVGVMGTPYEGGFFYFILKCPKDYPIIPPKVRLMTTDGGRVRFNPNLYKNGKVCLSILGTWAGPAWSPAQQLATVLISIQSLLCEKPYHNEPGYERERNPGDAENYSEIVRHETLRVAVCGMLECDCHLNMPKQLVEMMETTFLQFYEVYIETIQNKLPLDSTVVYNPFTQTPFKFEYKKILVRLEALRSRLMPHRLLPVVVIPNEVNSASHSDESDDKDDN